MIRLSGLCLKAGRARRFPSPSDEVSGVKGDALCSRCRSREFPRPLLSRPRPAKPNGAWKRHQGGRFVTAAGCNEYPLESGLPLVPFPSTGSVSGKSEGTHGSDWAERSFEPGRRAASAYVRRSAPDSMLRSAWEPQAIQTSAARRRQGWKPKGERRRLDAPHDSPVGNAEMHISLILFFACAKMFAVLRSHSVTSSQRFDIQSSKELND